MFLSVVRRWNRQRLAICYRLEIDSSMTLTNHMSPASPPGHPIAESRGIVQLEWGKRANWLHFVKEPTNSYRLQWKSCTWEISIAWGRCIFPTKPVSVVANFLDLCFAVSFRVSVSIFFVINALFFPFFLFNLFLLSFFARCIIVSLVLSLGLFWGCLVGWILDFGLL